MAWPNHVGLRLWYLGSIAPHVRAKLRRKSDITAQFAHKCRAPASVVVWVGYTAG